MWSLIEGEDYLSFEWAAKILAMLGGEYIFFFYIETYNRIRRNCRRNVESRSRGNLLGLGMLNQAAKDQAES